MDNGAPFDSLLVPILPKVSKIDRNDIYVGVASVITILIPQSQWQV
jgi:hypothetical protein